MGDEGNLNMKIIERTLMKMIGHDENDQIDSSDDENNQMDFK